MIAHQSPFGQTIMFTSEIYYALSDEQLSIIEESYAHLSDSIIICNDENTDNLLEDDINYND